MITRVQRMLCDAGILLCGLSRYCVMLSRHCAIMLCDAVCENVPI
jgi:hypothetical protein